MLAMVLLSQHRVSSSKTVTPRAPCGARCIGHVVRTWSAVCSEAPHSQFGEGARPHLCMDEWSLPTPLGGEDGLPDEWDKTAEMLRKTAETVLGATFEKQKGDRKIWWWNEEVQESIK